MCDLDGRWPGKDAVTDSLVRAASRLTDVRWANAVRGEYTRRVQKPHGCITSHVCRSRPLFRIGLWQPPRIS